MMDSLLVAPHELGSSLPLLVPWAIACDISVFLC
jgi:hypothetical protein